MMTLICLCDDKKGVALAKGGGAGQPNVGDAGLGAGGWVTDPGRAEPFRMGRHTVVRPDPEVGETALGCRKRT